MKFIQTDSTIDIQSGGAQQVFIAVVFILLGVAAAVFGLRTPNTDHTETTRSTDDTTTTTSPHAGIIIVGVGVLFAAVGILVAFLARKRHIIIERNGTTTVTTKRLIGGKEESQNVPTASIASVRLSTYMNNTVNNGTDRSTNNRESTLSLVLHDTSVIDVASKSGGGGFSVNGMNVSNLIAKAPLSKEANAISLFLGVPLDANDMSTISGVVHSVRNAWDNRENVPQSSTPQQVTNVITQAQQNAVSPQLQQTPQPQPASPQTIQPTQNANQSDNSVNNQQ